jgi:hypothetical protein
LLAGRFAIEIGAGKKMKRIASLAVGFEAILLGMAIWTEEWEFKLRQISLGCSG